MRGDRPRFKTHIIKEQSADALYKSYDTWVELHTLVHKGDVRRIECTTFIHNLVDSTFDLLITYEPAPYKGTVKC